MGERATISDWVARGNVASGQKSHFFFRTTNATGEIRLPDGVEMVMPDDNAALVVCLDKPVALDIGSRRAVREGGKTVGFGGDYRGSRVSLVGAK